MRQVENLSGLVEGLKALAADMQEDAARFAAYAGTTVEALRALPENDRPAINEKWRAWIEAGKPAADTREGSGDCSVIYIHNKAGCTMHLLPDSKLSTGDELRARLQDILRAQTKEQERSPHDRRGQARPDLMRKQMDKLHKLTARADAIRARLRAMGERLWN